MMKKALIICSEYPYPMNSGDKLSTNGYVLALRKMFCLQGRLGEKLGKKRFASECIFC